MNPKHSSIDLETRLIGGLMCAGIANTADTLNALMTLEPSDFFHQHTIRLYAIIKHRHNNNRPFAVADMLQSLARESPELNQFFMKTIEGSYFTERHLAHDTQELSAMSVARTQLKCLQGIISDAATLPHREAIKELQKCSDAVLRIQPRGTNENMNMEQLLELYENGGMEQAQPIPTRINFIDSAIKGANPASMITIAAGAGVGKTLFAVYLMNQLLKSMPEHSGIFYSLEMTQAEIWKRFVGVTANRGFDSLTADEVVFYGKELTKKEISIFTDSQPEIGFIEASAKREALKKPVGVIVVDYLGLVKCQGNFERNDLRQAEIAQRLAALALDLNCIIIALSQVNRESAKRAKDDRCPYPQDAADSQGAYRASALWIGIDRPELYMDEPHYKEQFVVKCRKNRFGGVFSGVLRMSNGVFEQVPAGYFGEPPAKERKQEFYEWE